MTYYQLLEKLQRLPLSTLQQTVTLYDISEDEFVDASECHYSDNDTQVLDPNHLYIAF